MITIVLLYHQPLIYTLLPIFPLLVVLYTYHMYLIYTACHIIPINTCPSLEYSSTHCSLRPVQ